MLDLKDLEIWAKSRNIKIDKRPKKGPFAYGAYTCKCTKCECQFMGDKRALWCGDCAYNDWEKESAKFIKELNEAQEKTKKSAIGPFK